MQVIETTYLTPGQKQIIRKLWNEEFPEKISHAALADFDTYLSNLVETNHYLLTSDFGEIEGWAFSFIRENEKWFVILLDRATQGRGNGTALLNKLKEKEQRLCGWVVDHNNDMKQNGEPYQPILASPCACCTTHILLIKIVAKGYLHVVT